MKIIKMHAVNNFSSPQFVSKDWKKHGRESECVEINWHQGALPYYEAGMLNTELPSRVHNYRLFPPAFVSVPQLCSLRFMSFYFEGWFSSTGIGQNTNCYVVSVCSLVWFVISLIQREIGIRPRWVLNLTVLSESWNYASLICSLWDVKQRNEKGRKCEDGGGGGIAP
jgi:hypothetical protein